MAKNTKARSPKAPLKEPVITLSAGPVAAYPRILRRTARLDQADLGRWILAQARRQDRTRRSGTNDQEVEPMLRRGRHELWDQLR